MRIAFLSDIDPQNPYHWSGTTRFVYTTLSKYHQVSWIGRDIAKGAMWHHRFLNNHTQYYPELYQEQIGNLISEELEGGEYDLVFTSTYFFIPHLKVNCPIVYLGDVTFPQFKKIFINKHTEYHVLVVATERSCLKLADAILYPSAWAKESAIQEYNLDAEKIHIIEFGANIAHVPDLKYLDNNECHLVFIGRNWENKGGDIVLETYRILQQKDFACRLTIIGCRPPNPIMDGSVSVYPWIDKNTDEGYKLFDHIMQSASFLILPTRFEAFGIVIAEASAYGIPSIVTNIGGTSQVVRDGKNGFLLPMEATPMAYAYQIEKCFLDSETYHQLRLTSRTEYETRLHWEVWGRRVTDVFAEVIMHPKEKEEQHDLYLPTYVLISHNQERNECILSQFIGKSEFEMNIVDLTVNENRQLSIWGGINKSVRLAQKNQDDIILIVKETFRFTSSYNREWFFKKLIEVADRGIELLLGGKRNLSQSLPIVRGNYKIEDFSDTQFFIVFSSLFDKILAYDFQDDDVVEIVLSKLTQVKSVI